MTYNSHVLYIHIAWDNLTVILDMPGIALSQ